MSGMSYQDAISSLNTLQSNAATLAAAASRVLRNEEVLAEMNEFVTRIGLTPDDLNALNVIHVTGTKGKGSTSAFTDLILRHAKPDIKVGLYTSPHLVAVRERIRINGRPLSEEEFAKYFFQVWKKLQDNPPITPGTRLMPNYFRYLTLVAFYAFKDLKVDATILEVGIGGGGDSTNVVPKPVVTGITALGMDHVAVLGGTIEAIARQKAGIYKKDVPAFTVEQHDPSTDLEAILRETAMNVKASEFRVVKEFSALKDIKLGLAGRHQWSNASLAVELARAFLTKKHPSLYPDPIPETSLLAWRIPSGLGAVRRYWTLTTRRQLGFLTVRTQKKASNVAFNGLPVPMLAYLSNQPTADAHRPLRVLIFNCTSGRSAEAFLRTIFNELEIQLSIFKSTEEASRFFDQVIFCSNVTYSDGHFKGDLTSVALASAKRTGPTTQDQLKVAWSHMVKEFPSNAIHSFPSIEHAVRKVREHSATRRTHVLVAGSLHLVGGVIEVAGLSSVALGDL
ncbi:FolC bifunctional protein [Boletus reticuloceps]|uniref:Folylpolyglutamate synthase n=1 Tax=Boletus reticuloceps TaxID=495285 RepID=A0A8I3AB08_9AGAM|nr:FolC bifunctional protein [Boletus reticuloceps]